MIDGLKDGLVSPQDGVVSPRMAQLVPRMAQLVPGWPSQSQDGLVSPQAGLVMADLLEKCTFFEDFFIRAIKLAANSEKQVFTFFAFLPPYIGVSGLLVYCKRQSLKRSIVSYKKIINFMTYGSVLSRFCMFDGFSIDLKQISNRFKIDFRQMLDRFQIDLRQSGVMLGSF